MKNVLIIMPQFAPSSYPVVHRGRFFAAHLEEFGWKPIVLTVEPRYLEEPPDLEFMKLIPKSLEIIRAKAFPARWTRMIGVGDLGIRSLWHITRKALKICRSRKIDALLISAPPWHTFLVGPKIKKEFDIPYVLDYTDPWVSSMGEHDAIVKKAFWFRKMALWLEPRAVRDAEHIITVSDGTSQGILDRYASIKPDLFTSIPLGGEKSDFELVKKDPGKNRFFSPDDGSFHFVYTGAMLPKAYETLEALFEAARRLRDTHPDVYKKMRFYFIGTTYAVGPTSPLVMPTAERFGVADIVNEHPKRVPYLESHTLLVQASAVFAIGTTEHHYTASKIFPCILADRPLLAIYHEASSVTSILGRTAGAELITYSDAEPARTRVTLIQQALLKIMDPAYQKPATDWTAFENYTAHAMTRRLASVLNDATTPKKARP